MRNKNFIYVICCAILLLLTSNNAAQSPCPNYSDLLDKGWAAPIHDPHYPQQANRDEFATFNPEPFIIKVNDYPPVKSFPIIPYSGCSGNTFYYFSFDTDDDYLPINFKMPRNQPNVVKTYKIDGNGWELKRITVNFRGNLITPILEGVFAFSNTDIWFVGSLPIQGDGQNWVMYDLRTTLDPNISLSKAWGTSSNDIYFVGRNGSIAHYNGQSWQRIESGTELPIRDIWGDFNEKTNSCEILAVAAEVAINNGRKVLRIDGNSVTEESNNGLSWDVGGIWFKPGRKYYIAGAGIHYKHFLSDTIWNRYPQGLVTNYVGYHIRGSDINDVFAAGSFLEIAHYNGVSWHNYLDEISSFNGAFGGIAIKDNMIVIVGFDGSSALVVIGKRN